MSDSSTPMPNVHAESLVNNSIIGLILATLCLALRGYVRFIMTKSYGLDDWVLLAAYVTFLTFTGVQIAYGVTLKENGLVDNFDRVMLLAEWHSFFYSVDQSFLKAALATFYLRILPKNSWQRTVVLWSTAAYVAYTMSLAFVFLFQCGDPMDMESTACLNGDDLAITNYVQAGLNAFMDWLLTLLPMTIIWKTQMSTRVKWSVVAIMALGASASAISVVRIFSISLGNAVGAAAYALVTRLFIMSFWENCIGQIAISLAALRPLLRVVFKENSLYTNGRTADTMPTKPHTGIAIERTYEVQDNVSTEELELINRWEVGKGDIGKGESIEEA
ncbi:hypothetical protein MBLNU459_g6057t1 [Dothideomycetes sp. NU459]